MKFLNDFKLKDVPLYKILFCVASSVDYEMSRIILVEDYPEYGDFVLIEGGHCSCYGFDETKWDATVYTEGELLQLMNKWDEQNNDYGYGLEKPFASMVKKYFNK